MFERPGYRLDDAADGREQRPLAAGRECAVRSGQSYGRSRRRSRGCASRIARPFRDAWGWASDLVGAKDDNEKLRAEVDNLRQQVLQSQTAVSENERLRAELKFIDGPSFPSGFEGVTTRVVGRAG